MDVPSRSEWKSLSSEILQQLYVPETITTATAATFPPTARDIQIFLEIQQQNVVPDPYMDVRADVHLQPGLHYVWFVLDAVNIDKYMSLYAITNACYALLNSQCSIPKRWQIILKAIVVDWVVFCNYLSKCINTHQDLIRCDRGVRICTFRTVCTSFELFFPYRSLHLDGMIFPFLGIWWEKLHDRETLYDQAVSAYEKDIIAYEKNRAMAQRYQSWIDTCKHTVNDIKTLVVSYRKQRAQEQYQQMLNQTMQITKQVASDFWLWVKNTKLSDRLVSVDTYELHELIPTVVEAVFWECPFVKQFCELLQTTLKTCIRTVSGHHNNDVMVAKLQMLSDTVRTQSNSGLNGIERESLDSHIYHLQVYVQKNQFMTLPLVYTEICDRLETLIKFVSDTVNTEEVLDQHEKVFVTSSDWIDCFPIEDDLCVYNLSTRLRAYDDRLCTIYKRVCGHNPVLMGPQWNDRYTNLQRFLCSLIRISVLVEDKHLVENKSEVKNCYGTLKTL